MDKMKFLSVPAKVRTGDVILWVNRDMFRHTATARFLGAGGNEGDVMRLHGWRSRSMLERYGAAVATERALNAHRRLQLNEDL